MPDPHVDVVQSDPVPVGKERAVDCRMESTWDGVRLGLSDRISEAIPLTCGVAILVP